jgi:glycosyltransferase involved in cell wall biosynthesis
MRVVVLADFAEPSGGAQAVALRSALSLGAMGITVTYVHGLGSDHDPRLDAAGIEVVGLGLPDVWDRSAIRGAASGIWSRDAARRLGTVLERLPAGPTILHLHQWTRSLSPSVFGALLSTGHPLVVTAHDYFISCPNGVYYRFDRGEPCNLRPLSPACLAAPCDPRSSLHKAVRVLRTAATRAALAGRCFDIVHVSDRGRDTLAPFLSDRLVQHRIDNPVEVVRGEPARIGEGARIAYLGRLTREKGADLVAAAAAQAGMPALFVGDGPAEADIRKLHPGAEILGWRPRAEIDALLRTGIRAVAAPSRWYETGPLTVYEALAAGVPAVASARSGAAEKVADGETGLIAAPNEEALAAAFRRLADTPTAQRLGAQAYRRYWAAPPSPEAHADALVKLYEAILARPAAA